MIRRLGALLAGLLVAATGYAFLPIGSFWESATMEFVTGDLCDTGVFPATPGDCSGDADNPDWSAEFVTALERWNSVVDRFNFTSDGGGVGDATAICELGDFFNPNSNSAFFDTQFCGSEFGETTLAVSRSTVTATDARILRNIVVFNSVFDWGAYDGANQFIPDDFRRVAVHEQGHSLGLGHSTIDDDPEPIMTASVGDTTAPQPDDLLGLDYLYGPQHNDLDKDLVHDVLLRHNADGRFVLHRLASRGLASTDLVGVNKKTFWSTVATNDFDGDGGADIMLRHTDGRWRLYLTDGPAIKDSGLIDLKKSPNWQAVAVADFDGDDDSDVLLRRTDTGKWRVTTLAGLATEKDRAVSMRQSLNWDYVGVGDFDRDGKADILLRNTVTRRWRLYFMNGTSISDEKSVDLPANPVWNPVAVRDFTGDGRTDVLLRHSNTGRWKLFELRGSTVVQKGQVALKQNLNWELQSNADMNFDGRADVLMRNKVSGDWRLTYLNGLAVVDDWMVPLKTNLNWAIAGVGYFDRNLTPDILLRNTDDGRWVVYYMERYEFADDEFTTDINESKRLPMKKSAAWQPAFTEPL